MPVRARDGPAVRDPVLGLVVRVSSTAAVLEPVGRTVPALASSTGPDLPGILTVALVLPAGVMNEPTAVDRNPPERKRTGKKRNRNK